MEEIEVLREAGFVVEAEDFPIRYHDLYLQLKFDAVNDWRRVQVIVMMQPEPIRMAAYLVGALMFFSTIHDRKWSAAILHTDPHTPPSRLHQLLSRSFRILEEHDLAGFYALQSPLDWSGKRFDYEDLTFDVTKGLEIVSDRKPVGVITVADWMNRADFNIEVDEAHVEQADLSQPLLTATFPRSFGGDQNPLLVIDGYHRLTKAYRLGVPTLRSWILTLSETYVILLSQAYRPVFRQAICDECEPYV